MAKDFLTYDQQVDKLVNEKGLAVPDRGYAIETLKRTSYFALVSGYKQPRQIEFRDELPKTAVGKILRRALR